VTYPTSVPFRSAFPPLAERFWGFTDLSCRGSGERVVVSTRGRKKLYTLSEVSSRTGISMPTLQRYKKLYQARLPAVGEGRRQRYPIEALRVFLTLKKESDRRRGRVGKKRTSARAVKRNAKSKEPQQESRDEGPLLTLLQVGRMTGISYPTLLRYVRLHILQIPHQGSGRRRRYRPEAVAVFQRLREQSRRGRRSASSPMGVDGGNLERRLERLEKGQRELARQLRELERSLKRPLKITLQR